MARVDDLFAEDLKAKLFDGVLNVSYESYLVMMICFVSQMKRSYRRHCPGKQTRLTPSGRWPY